MVLDGAGLQPFFKVVLSTEGVARGKPAPDVYLEAARRLAIDPARSVAIEDSSNGIRAAVAAGLRSLKDVTPQMVIATQTG